MADAMTEAVVVVDAELLNPDPDPDRLPALPSGYTLQEEIACTHLVRAILKAEKSIDRLKAAMEKEIEAWGHMVAGVESKRDSWRMVVRDFILRRNGQSIKTPGFTAFISKGRRRLTWQEEDKILAILDLIGAAEAVQVRRSVKKKEFTTIYDSTPKQFEGLVTDETGESVLVIKVRLCRHGREDDA